ncbi:hypothetical protein CerSpe_276700 [Prunus speciosa]
MRAVTAGGTAEYTDDYCKEVHCIQMEESRWDKNSRSPALSTIGNEGTSALTSGDTRVIGQELISTPVNVDREGSQMQNGFAYGTLKQRLHDVQMTIDSLGQKAKKGQF